MSVKTLYPTTQPSLLLDFANVKQLDPRVTFVRTTTATYYDGVTTAKAEENLLLRSQEFENAAWNKTNTTITANNATAPDGTSTAETVTATAGTNIDAIVARFNLSSTAGLDYVISFFAKAGTYSAFQITNGNFQASSAHANFDLSAGTVGTSANCTASIQNAGNSWYRCIVVFAATATVTSGAVYACLAASTSASRFQKWSPVGTETIELWGAQLEQRSAVTAYTPTTTQPITNYIPVLLTAPAGVARFDHNPTTGESLGLLIEEQRTNLWLRSEEFDNATWVKDSCTVLANATISPDGTLTADRFVPNAGALANSRLRQGFAYTAQQFTYTVYAKKDGNFLYYATASAAVFNPVPSVYVDLTDGSVLQSSNATTTVTSVGNGWYRISIKPNANAVSGTSSFGILHGAADAVGSSAVTGNGYSGIFFWGAQLEAGAFPTSYIPTVAATVTRNADAATMTGTNFSSWYRQDEGSIFTSFNVGAVSPIFKVAFHAFIDTTARGFQFVVNANGASASFNIYNDASEYQGTAPFPATPANSSVVAVGSYKTDDSAASINVNGSASAPTTDTSVILPSGLTQLSIGRASNGSGNLNGHIRKLAYYPKRLTNAELQGLTS
jgi:hypothetical protein